MLSSLAPCTYIVYNYDLAKVCRNGIETRNVKDNFNGKGRTSWFDN